MIQRYGAEIYKASNFMYFLHKIYLKIFALYRYVSYLCGMKNRQEPISKNVEGKTYCVGVCKLYRRRGAPALKNLTLTHLPQHSSTGRNSFELRDGVRIICNEDEYGFHLLPSTLPFWGATPLEAAQKFAEHYAKNELEKRAAAAKYKAISAKRLAEIKAAPKDERGFIGKTCN